MRDHYNFPKNEGLIAAAVKLEWIPLAIDTTDDPKRRHDQAVRGFECNRLISSVEKKQPITVVHFVPQLRPVQQ